jgi:hypothetical protein
VTDFFGFLVLKYFLLLPLAIFVHENYGFLPFTALLKSKNITTKALYYKVKLLQLKH